MRIIFFGTPGFAVPVLQELINGKHKIVGVFTGQGPIESEAKKQNTKLFTPSSLKNNEEIFEQFKKLNPDICIVAAYGKLIPSRYLEIPKYGFVNIHPSLLPKYRGPSPIQTAVLNGDATTGVSIMLVDEEMDHGTILAQQEFLISNFQFTNHDELAKELFTLGARLLVETLPKYISGGIKPQEQNHTKATFTKKFERKDGKIKWDQTGEKIYNQIRALNPEPGTWTRWQGRILNIKELRHLEVELPSGSSTSTTGTVLKTNDNIAVSTKTCYLILKKIQLEGGKVVNAKEFVNGHPDFLNSTLE